MPRRFYTPPSGSGVGLEFVTVDPGAATNLATSWRFASPVDRATLGQFNRMRHALLASVGNWNTTTEEAESPPFTVGVLFTPPLTGRLPSGTWTLSLPFRGFGGAGSPDFRFRWKAFRGKTLAGSHAQLHSAAVLLGTTSPGPSNGSVLTATATFAAPALDLIDERIFINLSIECRETLAFPASGSQRDMNLRNGSFSYLEIPDLAPVESVGGVLL